MSFAKFEVCGQLEYASVFIGRVYGNITGPRYGLGIHGFSSIDILQSEGVGLADIETGIQEIRTFDGSKVQGLFMSSLKAPMIFGFPQVLSKYCAEHSIDPDMFLVGKQAKVIAVASFVKNSELTDIASGRIIIKATAVFVQEPIRIMNDQEMYEAAQGKLIYEIATKSVFK